MRDYFGFAVIMALGISLVGLAFGLGEMPELLRTGLMVALIMGMLGILCFKAGGSWK